jgi:hypothetical protein
MIPIRNYENLANKILPGNVLWHGAERCEFVLLFVGLRVRNSRGLLTPEVEFTFQPRS